MQKNYQRNCLLGALGALLMAVGDLCLSIIPASPNDSGLFLREAYLSGSYEPWRLPLLLATGLIGMALCSFAVRAFCAQILPQYSKTRMAVKIGGVIYIASAGVIHFIIGSLADWTSTLSPLLGREETATLIQAQYERLMPAMLISYIGMFLTILVNAFALLTKKTFLPRWMFVFHLLVWQIVFAAIPDIRQLCGAEVSTWDFVLSQSSGNVSLFICMVANAVYAKKLPKNDNYLKVQGDRNERL